MPRKPRLHVPGAIHHVMSRGIEGKPVFGDDEDRLVFLDLLGRGLQRTGFHCYAWVLMDNHYHMVLRTNDLPLASLFKPLNGTYARRFGKRHGRHGYLFQERFKSIATQDQKYVEELIGYVHLNPVRAGICRDLDSLDRYLWSGHGALVGTHECPFQTVEPVLRFFGKTGSSAIAGYRRFLRDILSREDESDIYDCLRESNKNREGIHDPGCWVIGEPEFVRQAISRDKERRLRLARYRTEGWDLDRLADLVAEQYEITRSDLMRRSRIQVRSDARKVFAFLAHRALGFPVVETAKFLRVSSPAVSVMIAQGSAIPAACRVGDTLNY